MANTSANLVALDFDTYKSDLIAYLQSKPAFQDYNFEGPNITVLMELLSYNTHKNAFYLNMALSESFLDSAQLRNSVVSHAKELNYTPVSNRSSKATVTVSFDASGVSAPYTIAKGSQFSTIVKNSAYTFSVPEAITVTSSNTSFEFETDLYEGYYVKDTYVYLADLEDQTFRITNKTVDTTSITVAVYEDGNETPDIYTKTETLLGLTSKSKVYFLQGIGNGYYEILFGDGVLGKQPKVNSVIVIDYRVSSGEAPDGASEFTCDFDPTGANELTSTVEVTTSSDAAGGSEAQSLDSIRKYAPRYFAAQQRAVSSDDYNSLILSQFSGSVSDVSVYGGETVEPKRYGRVIVALKPSSGTIAPDYIKGQVSSYLKERMSIPSRVIMTDPEYLYCKVTSTVYYNKALTTKKAAEIKTLVINEINDYSTDNLEVFNGDLRYSRLVKLIDDADGSIVSNDTSLKIIKRLTPTINTKESFTFSMNNALVPKEQSVSSKPVVESSLFTYQDDDGNNYEGAFIKDNGEGILVLKYTVNGTETTLKSSIGTVDHDTGDITITDIRAADYTNYISIYATPLKKDIIMSSNLILVIDSSDTSVTVEEFIE